MSTDVNRLTAPSMSVAVAMAMAVAMTVWRLVLSGRSVDNCAPLIFFDRNTMKDEFLRLLDRLDEVIWCRDASGRLLFVNRAVERVFGVDRGAVNSGSWGILRHVAEEDRGLLTALSADILERGVSVATEVRPPGKDPHQVDAWTGPLHDESGNVIALAGIARLASRRGEPPSWAGGLDEARSERDDLRAILDRIRDGFFALDPAWRFTYVNGRFEELTGIRSAAALGRYIFDVFPEARDSVFAEQYALAMRENRPVHFEARYEPLSLWVEVHAYPSHLGLSVFVRDITERRRLETEVQEAATRERQRLGAELHDSVGQKLTGAALLLRALEARAESGDAIAPADVAAVGKVLAGLVAETRRIGFGLFPVELQDDSLGAALGTLARDMADLFGVSCSVHVRDEPPLADTVALHLFRIAQELVTNAVKHGCAGVVAIELVGTDRAVELCVTHDGTPPGSDRAPGSDGTPDSDDTAGPGLGLRTMEYRARSIGGSLSSTRTADGRVRTVCRVPA